MESLGKIPKGGTRRDGSSMGVLTRQSARRVRWCYSKSANGLSTRGSQEAMNNNQEHG